MRIVQLVYALGQGGAERFVVNISNEMTKRGHEVTILQLLDDSDGNRSFNKQFLLPETNYINLGFTPGFTINKIKKVCDVIKQLNPDIVHCHLNVIPYIFPLAIRHGSIKFIHTLHSIAQKASGIKIQKPINNWFYKTGRIIPATISEECCISFKQYYNTSKPVIKIDNGTVSVTPSPKFTIVQKELALINPSQKPIFAHVARFSEPKNQRLLIDAFNLLNKNGDEAILIIIGDRFDSDEGRKLKNSACSAVHFLGLKANVGDYLLNSNYFILSSNYEGLPISLIEAMSAGCTPVCTPVGGIPDVIKNGITGYLSDNLSIDNFVSTIRRAIAKPIDKEVITDDFRKRFSIEQCVDKYLNVYNSTLNQ